MTAQVTSQKWRNQKLKVQAPYWRKPKASEMTLTTRARMVIPETELKERREMIPRTTAPAHQTEDGIDLVQEGVIVKGNVLMNHESEGLTLKIEITDQEIEIDGEKVPEIGGEGTAVAIVLKIARDVGPEVDIVDQDRDLGPDLVD